MPDPSQTAGGTTSGDTGGCLFTLIALPALIAIGLIRKALHR